MQKLHLVGYTTDHLGLILSPRRSAKTGSYMIALDKKLIAALDAAREQMEPDDAVETALPPPRRESLLTIKEVQARLRAGRSIAEVASEAKMDTEWVARFAVPILAEQAEIVRALRNCVFVKPRLGESGYPIGEAVYRNLVDKGVGAPADELDKAWSARQLADGTWRVVFRYANRGRNHRLSWDYDDRTGSVVARDRLAGSLAHRPGRKPAGTGRPRPNRQRQADDDGAPTTSTVSKRMAAARKAARAQLEADVRRSTRRDAAAAREVASRPRPAPAKASTKKAAAKKAAEKKPVTKKPVTKTAAAKKAAAKKPTATRKATAVKKAAPARAAAKKTSKKTAKKTATQKTAKRATPARRRAGVAKLAPRKAAAKRAVARGAGVKRAAPKKAAARRVASRRAPAKKSTARKAPTRKAPAKKATARKAPARKTGARRNAARKTTARKAASARRAPLRAPRADLAELRSVGGLAGRSTAPVFRTDLARPAADARPSNGRPGARPRRTQPLRAR